MATKGYAAPEVERVYTRAREVCRQMEDSSQLFPVLRGLWIFYLIRVELQTARELAEQLLSLAQRQQDVTLLLEAHYALGNSLNYLGEFAAAQKHLEQGMLLYNSQKPSSSAFHFGYDSGVACLSYAALNLWLLGSVDQSLTRNHEALMLAQELAHPQSLAYALFMMALLHWFRREGQDAYERAEATMTLSTEQGFAHWMGLATVLQGWALAERGQRAEGIGHIRQGLAAWQTTGARGGGPIFLALLAETYGKAEQPEKGLAVLAEALALVHDGGECRSEAELYRLKGALLLQQSPDNQPEAETCFHQALAIARQQQAKSWELRAATSLARLWQSQDKCQDATDLLAPVYGWFTEGFDTADVQEAKALLQELAGGA